MTSDERFHKKLGHALRGLREAEGISREKAAHAAELSPRFLADLEAGRKSPSMRTLRKLAKALDVKASTIIRRAEDS